MRAAAGKLTIHPATASRWADVAELFGERGACGGCWCMAWRKPAGEFRAAKGAGNRRSLKRIIEKGEAPGVIGYRGGKPVAWCAVAPRAVYSFLQRSRVLREVDDRPVWSISCLFVLRPYRRQGLSVQMLKAAAAFAGRRGAEIVEGYPSVPYERKVPDAFIWTGTASAFKAAGFTEVARRSKSRPIMRLTC